MDFIVLNYIICAFSWIVTNITFKMRYQTWYIINISVPLKSTNNFLNEWSYDRANQKSSFHRSNWKSNKGLIPNDLFTCLPSPRWKIIIYEKCTTLNKLHANFVFVSVSSKLVCWTFDAKYQNMTGMLETRSIPIPGSFTYKWNANKVKRHISSVHSGV